MQTTMAANVNHERTDSNDLHGEEQQHQHVFTRADLLRNYQALEKIAARLPADLLERPRVVQMETLVGAFEHHLLHDHLGHECHHHEEKEGHNHAHCHGDDHHDSHAAIDPYEEERKLDLLLLQYRNRIHASYKPLIPSIYDFNTWPIDPALKKFILQHPAHKVLAEPVEPVNFLESHPLLRLMPLPSAAEVKDVPESVRDSILELLKEVAPGIFVFDFLPVEFCDKLLEEILHFESWCKANKERVNRPNSMNNYGVILDDMGFEQLLEQLISQYVNVLSSIVYPYIGATLDHHHGFVVAYEMGKDETLSMHVDDADVTLNVCIGKKFTKGELLFTGMRCNHHQSTTPPFPEEEVRVENRVGQAILHVGRHRHAAMPITSGHRYNFILWCRSSKFRRLDTLLDCPDWCPIAPLLEAQQPTAESAPAAPSI